MKSKTVTCDGNHINLVRTLEDYNILIVRTFQYRSSLLRRPVFNI